MTCDMIVIKVNTAIISFNGISTNSEKLYPSLRYLLYTGFWKLYTVHSYLNHNQLNATNDFSKKVIKFYTAIDIIYSSLGWK